MGQRVEHRYERVVNFIEQVEQRLVRREPTILDVRKHGLGAVREVAHGYGTGHARAALERVQRALEIEHRRQIVALGAPACQ